MTTEQPPHPPRPETWHFHNGNKLALTICSVPGVHYDQPIRFVGMALHKLDDLRPAKKKLGVQIAKGRCSARETLWKEECVEIDETDVARGGWSYGDNGTWVMPEDSYRKLIVLCTTAQCVPMLPKHRQREYIHQFRLDDDAYYLEEQESDEE
jgi:hypothetical protein